MSPRGQRRNISEFPFLFGGTFIEGFVGITEERFTIDFPSFSEGLSLRAPVHEILQPAHHFPSFSEGLSLRDGGPIDVTDEVVISLPFRRDFH